MTSQCLEVGKVAYIVFGPSEGKIGIILDIVDEKRCLIDGPCGRQIINIKRIELTGMKIDICKKSTSKNVHHKLLKEKVLNSWFNSKRGKKCLKNSIKNKFNDFEHFKFMIGRKFISRVLRFGNI